MSKPQASKQNRARAEARRREVHRRAETQRKYRAQFSKRNLTPEMAEAVRKTRATVTRARLVTVDAERRIDVAVIKLRTLGCSWDQIAAATDLSRQGAMKRHAAALKRMDTGVASKDQ